MSDTTKAKSAINAQYELAGGGEFDWTILPSAENGRRWNASMKSYVVLGLQLSKITREELQGRYTDLSDQEITSWELRLQRDGQAGLRVTRIQMYDGRDRQSNQGRLAFDAK